MDITSWIIFPCFKYIWLALDLIYSIILRNPKNIEKFEHMEYICDKRICIIKFKSLNIYFKIRVVDGIFGWFFFMMNDINVHQLNIL
jgi:hypothetical protein